MAAKTTTATRPATKKGKRYSDAQREKIISHVNEINAQKGRGGVAAAARKYNVSPLSINNWIKKGETGGAPTGGAVKRGGRPKKAAGGSVWDQLVAVKNDLDRLEADLGAKRAQFDKLKARL